MSEWFGSTRHGGSVQSFCDNVGVVEILATGNSSRVIAFAVNLLGKNVRFNHFSYLLTSTENALVQCNPSFESTSKTTLVEATSQC